MFRHVSKSGQTLGNISEKDRETSNVSEFAKKHFCFSGSKFCFSNNVSTGGQTGKHLRKHRESQMFRQQCFLVCPGLNFLLASQYIYCNLILHVSEGNSFYIFQAVVFLIKIVSSSRPYQHWYRPFEIVVIMGLWFFFHYRPDYISPLDDIAFAMYQVTIILAFCSSLVFINTLTFIHKRPSCTNSGWFQL